jgi:hypothetical protein
MTTQNSNTPEKLLQEVALFFGLEELSFDEEGYCMLQIEEQWNLILRHDTEYQRFLLMGKMQLPEKPSLALYEALLQFNFQKAAQPGPWIGLDANKEQLFLLDAISLELAEKDHSVFSKRFRLFIEQYLATQGLFGLETWEELAANSLEEKSSHESITS